MAKQLINVGSQANDGTGDSIRSGAQKLNSTINELYNGVGDGTNILIDINNTTAGNVLRSNGSLFTSVKLSYNDLSNLPIIPAAQVNSDWNATSGSAAILNKPSLFSGDYEDLINKPEFANISITGSYNDLIDSPNLSTVALSGSYADLTNKPNLFSGSYVDLTNKPSFSEVAFSGDYADLINTPGTGTFFSGSWNDLTNKPTLSSPSPFSTVAFSGSYADLSNKPSTLSPARTTLSATTTSLANNASVNLDVTGFKSYLLMKITTSRAAWITIYTDQTSRTADASRSETTDPSPGSGVIAEVITTGTQTVLLTPGTIGFNNDATPSNYIYMKVKNISGSTGTVDVTLTILQLEL